MEEKQETPEFTPAPPVEVELDQYPTTPAAPDIVEETVQFNRSFLFGLLLPLAFLLGMGAGYLFWGRGGVALTAADVAEIRAAAADARALVNQLSSVQPASPGAAADTAPGASAQPGSAGENTGNPGDTSAQPESTPTSKSVVRYNVPTDDDPSIGPADAEITIIEFSDYECPFCSKWHDEVFFRLLEDYPDQVRIVYRDFPLENIHPNAIPAAEAANCANEQDKFWDYHNLLFSGARLSRATLMDYATQVGLDLEAFTTCLDSGKYNAEVMEDFNFAADLGVRSTPTFFINGIALVGAQPYDVFKQVIDGELNGEFD